MVLTGDEPLRERLLAAPLEAMGDRYALRFAAMGTRCEIQFAAASPAQAGAFRVEALSWLATFEETYSRFRPDSLVSRINRQAGGDGVAIGPETEGIFQLCDWYHWLTRGVFDPTSLPLLQIWDYRRAPFTPPDAAQVEAARRLVGWPQVERSAGAVRLPVAGMALDLGGIGKEYAVDRVIALAREAGLQHVLVDFGHDVRVLGEPPEGGAWRIGLEDPGDPDRCWAGVALHDRAICTSGDYRRVALHGGRRFGHIIDPRTGRPVEHPFRSATVIAPTCTEAGILSTAAFLLGMPDGLSLIEGHHQAEGCLSTEKMRHYSGRFHAYLV